MAERRDRHRTGFAEGAMNHWRVDYPSLAKPARLAVTAGVGR